METEAAAKVFITMMKDKFEGTNLDDFLNRVQTPIPYSYYVNKMLDIKVSKMVHTIASTTNTMHVTFAITVSASGKMLPPFLIFKVKTHGHITM